MAAPKNGTDILLVVEESPGVWVVVASQRGVTFNEERSPIDAATKDDDAMVQLYGRYTASLELSSLWVPAEASLLALRDALRNKTTIDVRRRDAGSDIEQATALVSSLSNDNPDQDVASFSATLNITGTWGAVV